MLPIRNMFSKESPATRRFYGSPPRAAVSEHPRLRRPKPYTMPSPGAKTLYLNLTCFGGADLFFQADGKDFGDVIYALKSKKNNLLLKLESCLNRDPATGVYFYGQPKTALDMLELTADDREMLLEELLSSGMFDKIIVDADFSFRADGLLSARVADKWILVYRRFGLPQTPKSPVPIKL